MKQYFSKYLFFTISFMVIGSFSYSQNLSVSDTLIIRAVNEDQSSCLNYFGGKVAYFKDNFFDDDKSVIINLDSSEVDLLNGIIAVNQSQPSKNTSSIFIYSSKSATCKSGVLYSGNEFKRIWEFIETHKKKEHSSCAKKVLCIDSINKNQVKITTEKFTPPKTK